MTISVALCTYNGERYLREQLASIARQTILPLEVVVCDDASTDGSAAIVAEFARTAPFTVRLCRSEVNLGSTRNFERAIRQCEGELIALCDQDDVWKACKLESLSSALAADPTLGGVFSDAELIDEQGRSKGRRLFEVNRFRLGKPEDFSRSAAIDLLLQHSVVTGATLMFHAVARELLVPIPTCWVHDGWIAWMLILHSRLSFLPEPLIEYRIHSSQQLGVGISSLRDKLRRSRAVESARYSKIALEFEELRSRWMEGPRERRGDDFERVLAMIEAKVAFMRERAGLASNPFARAGQILTLFPEYRRYARGYRSMRKDLLLAG